MSKKSHNTVLDYSPEAVEDLSRLRSFIAQHNPNAAQKISKKLLENIKRLIDFPFLGKPVSQAPEPEKIRDLITGQYVVRYLTHEQQLYILRIWHQRENRD